MLVAAATATLPAIATGAPRVAPAQVGTAWAATATGAFPAAQAAGTVAPGRPVHVVVSLAVQHRAELEALLVRQQTPGSPYYHRWLTPAQFTSRFAPSARDAGAVADYLREQGFSEVGVLPNRLAVSATGTATAAQAAFHTTLRTTRAQGREIHVNTSPVMVPARLARTVQTVLGLTQVPYQRSPLAGADALRAGAVQPVHGEAGATPQAELAGFFPKQLAAAYNAGSTPTGGGTPIALIVANNQDGTLTDLRAAEAGQGLPTTPVTTVYTGAAESTTDDGVEWDLDAQVSTGVAGGASRLYLYSAAALMTDQVYLAESRFVTDNLARAASESLYVCDSLTSASATAASDQLYAQANAQGQTLFASSGDLGSSCPIAGFPSSDPTTSFPASSRYVVGVGGTTLTVDANGRYASESTWEGSGGGLSRIETRPPWQANAARGLGDGRAVPDVAADGDPDTGVKIYYRGRVGRVGGTSLSSPLWLGVWARLQSAARNGLGTAGPLLYGLYDKANPPGSPIRTTPGFHDVTTGSNGEYAAKPGYDLTTGIGTPDITALAAALGVGTGGTTPAARRIVGRASNRCLTVPGAADRTLVVLSDCAGRSDQTWTPTAGRFVVRSTGKCLDVRGGARTDGTLVQQYTCSTGNQAQQWVVRADGSIVNPASGKCLDAVKKGTANGTGIQIWGCNPAATATNQRWTLAPA